MIEGERRLSVERMTGIILVVDDEEQVVAALKEFLATKGYEVHTATNGRTAISKVKEVRPHIVFLDIIMPGMDGFDTLKEIKKIDPAIAVIMATAVSDEVVANRTVELGASDYVMKPFDLNQIETVVLAKLVQMMG